MNQQIQTGLVLGGFAAILWVLGANRAHDIREFVFLPLAAALGIAAVVLMLVGASSGRGPKQAS